MPRKGEANHRASEPDWVVELARELREAHGWSYGAIAAKLEVPMFTVRDWCEYRTRVNDVEGRSFRWRYYPR